MTSPHVLSQLGEVMLKGIGLLKYWTVLGPSTMYGPSQRVSLEPAYLLGDRRHIPEAQNAVESVLRTELLDAIPKSIAEACMRHGYCTAELIVWYVMKQLILPPDILTVVPSTLDQGCAWLEEMQHRLNLCIGQAERASSSHSHFWTAHAIKM